MNLNEYQNLSKRTMPDKLDKKAAANYAMGISGEAGEVTDIFKKVIFHGHKDNYDEIRKELGDVLHYLSGLATICGMSLEDVAQKNIDKLQKRYPNGFSEQDSRNRND